MNNFYEVEFVTSALNEGESLEVLLKEITESMNAILPNTKFRVIYADNNSFDNTYKLSQSIEVPCDVLFIKNARDYGPEMSLVNALKVAKAPIIGILASDLQDPPKLLVEAVQEMLLDPTIDAYCGIKKSSFGLRSALGNIYYNIIYMLDRKSVLKSFHAFGAYRHQIIEAATQITSYSGKYLRFSLVDAIGKCKTFMYSQRERRNGKSSYKGYGCLTREAIESLRKLDNINSPLIRVIMLILALTVLLGPSTMYTKWILLLVCLYGYFMARIATQKGVCKPQLRFEKYSRNKVEREGT